MPAHDWIVVGAGITGCTIAETLAAAGSTVKLLEKREHLGGNCADVLRADGVRVHRYGPHIFHTNSDEVLSYLSRFTEWRPYEHRVLGRHAGRLVELPVNLRTLRELLGERRGTQAADELVARYGAGSTAHVGELRSDARLGWIGEALWRAAHEQYSAKQWGGWLGQLDPAVLARVPVRLSNDNRYFTDTHQAMPLHGYRPMFERMVAENPRIDIELGASAIPKSGEARRGVVFTGPIDEYFGHRFGRLPYRSVRTRFETRSATAPAQAATVVNYLDRRPLATRSTDYRWLAQGERGETLIGWEYPFEAGPGDVEMYPVPTAATAALYRRYERAARSVPDVHFCGRLGTYRYLNMDAAVEQALALARDLLG